VNIFFDLDGTLLDSRERLYQLFQHLVPESDFSFDNYWELKRSKIGHQEIFEKHLLSPNGAFSIFEKAWMSKIELPEWLQLDQPFEGVTDFLIDLKKRHKLYVVTARQFENVAIQQVEQAGWTGIFEEILVTGQKAEKYELIKSISNTSSEDWFVGDTGKDIQTGKQLGFNTAAVLSGFLSKEELLKYNPDIIAENVMHLKFD
jgi:phosphoglycolate phosphatase